MLTECRGDLEREGRGLLPLLIGVEEESVWVGVVDAHAPDPSCVGFVPRLTTSVVEPCRASN